MTAREVSVVIEGARWRQEHAERLVLMEAWHTAVLTRMDWKKFPKKLSDFLKSMERKKRQSQEELRAALLIFAANHGLTITRHERPVM